MGSSEQLTAGNPVDASMLSLPDMHNRLNMGFSA